MYEDPFSDVNYVTGSVLGLNLYDLYKRDPAFFIPNYVALLRNGFNAPPDVLLKRFLKIDLRDPAPVTNAMRIVEERITQLEETFRRRPALPGFLPVSMNVAKRLSPARLTQIVCPFHFPQAALTALNRSIAPGAAMWTVCGSSALG